MDEIATKAIIISVSIFVTLIIVTVVIFEFEQISNIYENVAETNISFEDRLDEFDKYRDSNNEFNGLDVRNTIEKYKDDKSVKICVDGDCEDPKIDKENYTDKYYSIFDSQGNTFNIIFFSK